jgi:hypothetical protein
MQHVAIQIAEPSPAAVPPELEAALSRACTVAVREGDCAVDGGRPEMQRGDVAIVRWEAGERGVRIEFTGRVDGGSRSLVRSLSFSDADERIERWRTVGLTIATLAGEAALPTVAEPRSQKPEPAAANADRAPQAAQTPRPVETSKLWLDVGGLVGTALDTASPRVGVWADVGTRFGGSAFIGLAGLEYSVARGEPFLSVQWLALSAGLGAQVGSSDRGLMFEGSASFSVERQQVSASDGARADSDAVFGYGGRARAALVWKLGVFSPLLGVEGWLNSAPIRVLVHDQYAGAAPRGGGVIVLGVRARLD